MIASTLLLSASVETDLSSRSGVSLEPVLGILMNDIREPNRAVTGMRLSALTRDFSDATLAGEIEGLAATRWSGSNSPGVDYLFQFGPAVYEFYQPWSFRVGAGLSTEVSRGDASLGFYYRGALGYDLLKRLGLFAEASGLMLFRSDQKTLPVALATTMQFLF